MNGLRVLVLITLALFVAGAAWARTGTLVQQAPPKARTSGNPFEGQQQALRAGAKLFARECAACHGPDGTGIGKAPPLNLADVQEAAPGALFWVLRNGSLKRGMPSFAHLPEAQRWQIITYLKTLKKR
jgi:mono/diheme cytochrome c family protein